MSRQDDRMLLGIENGVGTMRIKYVVSTMVFWGREHPLSFEQECQFLASLGFGIELWPNIKSQTECRYDRRNWARLAAATEGMDVVMRSRDDNPTLAQWAEQIECAELLNASIVTDSRNLGIPTDKDLNGSAFAGDVVALADRHGVKLCLETGPLPILKQAGERFESIWYCLDTGYAYLDSERSFRQYVDDLAPRTAVLHLSDNYGQMDDHETPGLRGGMPREDWNYLLEVLNKCDHKVVGSLEMCPCMPAAMIRRASEFLFDLLKWPNRPRKQPGYSDASYNPM